MVSGPQVAPRRFTHQRHRPEQTLLHAAVASDLETMLQSARQDSDSGAGLPAFVEEEFRRYLDCGILAKGFVRLRCEDCRKETLVAFSCKRRALCPSCGLRRMQDVAAHLVEDVTPTAR